MSTLILCPAPKAIFTRGILDIDILINSWFQIKIKVPKSKLFINFFK